LSNVVRIELPGLADQDVRQFATFGQTADFSLGDAQDIRDFRGGLELFENVG